MKGIFRSVTYTEYTTPNTALKPARQVSNDQHSLFQPLLTLSDLERW